MLKLTSSLTFFSPRILGGFLHHVGIYIATPGEVSNDHRLNQTYHVGLAGENEAGYIHLCCTN